MPYGENDPSPEYFKVEIVALLTSLVDLWINVDVLVIYILLKRVSKEAGPGGP